MRWNKRKDLKTTVNPEKSTKMKSTHYQKLKVCPACQSSEIYHTDGNNKTDYELSIIGMCISCSTTWTEVYNFSYWKE
jgi:DNA-directed RNA polymerase subunit M/transcription elongation factor TFIIS